MALSNHGAWENDKNSSGFGMPVVSWAEWGTNLGPEVNVALTADAKFKVEPINSTIKINTTDRKSVV